MISKKDFYKKYASCREVYAIACVTWESEIVSWVGHEREISNSEVGMDSRLRRLWTDKREASLFMKDRLVLNPWQPGCGIPFDKPGRGFLLVTLAPPAPRKQSEHKSAWTPAAQPGFSIQIQEAYGYPLRYYGSFAKGTFRVWPTREAAEKFRKEILKGAYLPHMLKVVPSPLTSPREGDPYPRIADIISELRDARIKHA